MHSRGKAGVGVEVGIVVGVGVGVGVGEGVGEGEGARLSKLAVRSQISAVEEWEYQPREI